MPRAGLDEDYLYGQDMAEENRQLRALILDYFGGDPGHAGNCAVYDAIQHGPCDCGAEALIEALQKGKWYGLPDVCRERADALLAATDPQ